MQIIKRIFLSVLFLLFVIMLCSCGRGDSAYPPTVSLNSNQIFLYDPFTYKLGTYNLDNLEWTEIDTQGALFLSFDWGNTYPYYTVGNAGTHKFYAGKKADEGLQFYFELDDENMSLVPFATDGKQFYYIAEQMNTNPCKKRILTISETGKAELIYNADGIGIMDGVIADNKLYYTSPCEDGSGNSMVWCLDITSEMQSQRPTLVKDAYSDYKLYVYKDQVMYVDTEKKLLYNDDVRISLTQPSTVIWLDSEAELLVEKYVTPDGNLEMSFTDISKDRVLGTYKDAVNFDVIDSIVYVYGKGFLEHLNLSEGE